MLTILFGTAKSGKTNKIYELLKENAVNGKNAALFVPEQFSFENERKLIDIMGESQSALTPILSFSRLCDEVKRLYGGTAGTIIDDSLRYILMGKVIKTISHEFKIFKSSSPSVISTIINSMNEFKCAGIPSDVLINASKNMGESILSNKIHDIALATSTYNALLQNKYLDPIDDLTFVYNKVREKGYFKGKTIYFDSFSSFTGQQFKIIKQAIIDADEVIITLCSDFNNSDEYSLFANVNKTAQKLISIAKKENIKFNIQNIENNNKFIKNIENFFNGKKTENVNNISVYNLPNKYDECEFAAQYIHRKSRINGDRYKDFAIVCRDNSGYKNIIKSIFGKYNLPIYVNDKTPLSDSLISKFILYAIKASRGYNTDNIMRLLKTGLTDFSDNDILVLDNYLYMWGINNEGWLDNWAFNPLGLRELNDKNKEKADKLLESLNTLRNNIIAPLIKLNKLKNGSVKDFCKALLSILKSYNIGNNLTKLVENLNHNKEYDNAQFQTNAWDSFNAVLDNIVNVYDDEIISFNEFFNILSSALSSYQIAGIPQGNDEVILTSPEKLNTDYIKNTIILGFNDGNFPQTNITHELFNATERAFLLNYDIEIDDKYISHTIEENYLIYKILTSPKDEIIITYHIGNYSEGKKEISNLLESLCNKMEISIVKENPNILDYRNIETKHQAFSLAFANISNTETANDILEQLSAFDNYYETIQYILNARNSSEIKLDNETAKKIYGKDINASPSRIEQYFKCPYAFFCKYGLNINKREKIDFKVMQRGTISHYVLEKFLKDNLDNLNELSNEFLIQKINEYVEEYISLTVGDYSLLDMQSIYTLNRIKDMLIELIEYICSDIKSGAFKPVSFELKIGEGESVKPLKIKSQEGTVTLGGIVDRVDMAEIDGQNYVRIVDYKTGKKDFAISDVLYGLNLQMLIYLCAICENSTNTIKPAGIIYQPLNHLEKSGINGEKINNSPKAKGILTDNETVLKQMDPEGRYMPFKFNNDGSLAKTSHCVSEMQFSEIFDYIKTIVAFMHKKIISGDISKNPCANDSKHRTCTYCEYKDVCRTFFEAEGKTIPSMKYDKFFETIMDGDFLDTLY